MRSAVRFVGRVIGFGLVTACYPLASVTSGQIGCPESAITISDDRRRDFEPGARTWDAECYGQHYFCSAHRGGAYSTSQVSCERSLDEQQTAQVVAATDAAPEREDSRVCEAAYQRAGDFATYWASRSSGAKSLDELPSQRDFVAVCRSLPESVQRCMHSGYLAAHVKACEAVLLRLEPPQRRRVDGLFLEAEAPDTKP